MSDSEDSTVTYTTVSSPFEGLSDIGSSGVNGPPVMPEDPYAYVVAAFQALPLPDYVPSPEEPKQAPLSPEFVPEDEVFPIKEKPLPAAVSPTTDSPRYIADSNPEDLKEDPEEDPIDYPTDRGDDDDDDDESFDDDEDDDDDVEKEEDEDHLALADSVPPPVHFVTSRMSVRAQTPISLPSDTEVARLFAIPTLPPSPLFSLSSPLPPILSPLPQILSPPLPSTEYYCIGTTNGDCSLASSRPRLIGTAFGDTKTDEYTADTGALTWWNSHVRTVGHDVAYAMTWTDLKKKMTDKYCPRGEIKKLEAELWNLKVKGTDVIGYNQRFQELALLCVRMFPEESDKIERYVGGLPDMIHRSVVASKPKTRQEAIEIATELMDKKIRTFAER
ncbi:reverse transcriptase domain-containing protein [Tanacetum coccineum]